MSAPNRTDHHEPDPLLAFFEEPQASQPAESAKSVQAAEPVLNAPDRTPVPAGEADPELRKRLEHAERQLERVLIEVTSVKGDLATLVNAVADIRKPTNRIPAKPSTVVPLPWRQRSRLRIMAAIVLLVAAGAAGWGVFSIAADDLSEPSAFENEPSSARPVTPSPELAPVVDSPHTQAPAAVPAAVSAPPPPAREVAAHKTPAVAQSPGEPGSVRRQPPRAVEYVGTLTVDAEPAGDVYLNRKNVGRTPVRLENLRAGSHLIWIEREGYRRWTRVVAVTADRISRVSVSLDPISR